jgi:PAS domain S-box-containing protein
MVIRNKDKYLEAINEFATTLLTEDDDLGVLREITKNVILKFGFTDCIIYLISKDGNYLEQQAAYGAKSIEESKVINPLKIKIGEGIVGSVAKSGISELIGDTSKDARYIVDDEKRLSELAVPIIFHGETIGVIDSENAEMNFYNQQHLETLQTIANLSAAKIKNVLLRKGQRHVQRELRESELRFRSILQNALDAVIAMNESGYITSWNTQAEKSFGWKAKEAIGQKLSDLIIPEQYRSMHDAGMKRFLETGVAKVINKRIEIDALNKEGRLFPVELTITHLKSEYGNTFSAFVRDISVEKENKQNLERSEAMFRNIVETASDLIYETNTTGFCTYVNPVAVKLLNMSSENLIGIHFSKLVSPAHLRRVMNFYAKQIEESKLDSYLEFPIVNSDGKETWIGQNARLIKNEDVFSGFMAVARDISERISLDEQLKNSEERYRGLIENIDLGLLELDLKEKIKYANESFCLMSGFSQRDLIGNKANDVLLNNFSSEEIEDPLIQDSGVYELEIVTKTGEHKWMLISHASMYDTYNNPLGSIRIHLDISYRKKVEAQMSEALEKEIELNELRSSFISMASHEFRTPLTTLKTNLELLTFKLEKSFSQKEANWLPNMKRMESEVERMTQLINNLLIKGKMDSKELKNEHQSTNIYELCEDLIFQSFSNQKDERTILLSLYGDTYNISLDKELMSYAISNLVSNAFKYSINCANPEMSIHFMEDNLLLKIKDYGIGIPQDERDKLFKPFFRASNTKAIPGTGLGLSIVKQFIELNDGKIELNMDMKTGTEFIVTLPKTNP